MSNDDYVAYPTLSQPDVYELQNQQQPFWKNALSQPDNPPPPPSGFLSDTQSLEKIVQGLKYGQGEVKFVEPFNRVWIASRKQKASALYVTNSLTCLCQISSFVAYLMDHLLLMDRVVSMFQYHVSSVMYFTNALTWRRMKKNAHSNLSSVSIAETTPLLIMMLSVTTIYMPSLSNTLP